MTFKFDKTNWTSLEEGEKNCFLLTNGLGGFTSLSTVSGVARGDHALFMAAKKAPNVRWHIITNVMEELEIDGESICLMSQAFVNKEDMLRGFEYLESFSFDMFPKWTYKVKDIVIEKSIIMVHQENTVGVSYRILNPLKKKACFKITPLFRDTPKNDSFDEKKKYIFKYENNSILFNETKIQVITKGTLQKEKKLIGPLYFSQDERDGRNDTGYVIAEPRYSFDIIETKKDCSFIFSLEKKYELNDFDIYQLFENEKNRIESIREKAGLKSDLANTLLSASDAYLVNRDSINGKSIIAGYPFFEDWGRDTMISLPGICLITKRFKECRQILETFAKYEKNGLLPNLFPEGDLNPMYNSVDAPLLFINTVYEYVKASCDTAFVTQMYPVMEDIMNNYIKGTDFHIKMDEDGLIKAGDDLEQLTWMDVRVNDFLPTPRHGKPVEINAYWYSACKIMEELSSEKEKKAFYLELANRTKESFISKFWNEEEGFLKDVLSGDYQEKQIRPNQIWALTMPFTMCTPEMEERILDTIKKKLYTTVGLRTLDPEDKDFHPVYIGDMEKRDRAYHQGTVWTFPLGAYLRGLIKQAKRKSNNSNIYKAQLDEAFSSLSEWLKEGCVGQLAEIYDGLRPTVSRGCFAQAWSVGEILRAVYEYDELNV